MSLGQREIFEVRNCSSTQVCFTPYYAKDMLSKIQDLQAYMVLICSSFHKLFVPRRTLLTQIDIELSYLRPNQSPSTFLSIFHTAAQPLCSDTYFKACKHLLKVLIDSSTCLLNAFLSLLYHISECLEPQTKRLPGVLAFVPFKNRWN